MKASAYFTVAGLGGNHGVKELKRTLDTLGGVTSVSVSQNKDRIAVDYDTTGPSCERIEKMIKDLGYDVLDVRLEQHAT